MTQPDARDRYVDQLHDRLVRLEGRQRKLLEALRQIDSLAYLRQRLAVGTDEPGLLDNLLADLREMFGVRIAGVSLAGAGGEFALRLVVPPGASERLGREFAHQIEEGIFAWALRNHRPTVVSPITPLAEGPTNLVLAPLSTGARTLGMALLVVDEAVEEIDAGRLTFLSILCKLYSFALENSALQRRMSQQNLSLEEEVRRRSRQIEEAHAQLATQHAQLLHAYERQVEIDRVKDEFLSLVSHELRTPLAGILGHVRALLDGVAGDRAEEEGFLRTVLKEGERLHRLVVDLLDLSKMEAGRIRYHFESIPVDDPIRWAISTVKASAAQKQVDVAIVSGLGQAVRGDLDRLTQVVTNVLDNAIRFSPHGGRIEVSARTAGGEVEVAIADRGPGIAPLDLPKVFDKFERIEPPPGHRSGSGLGLAISSSIVQAHGGRMWVESVLGEGATFRFTIPLAPEGAP